MKNENTLDFLTIGNDDINTSTGEFTPLEEGLYPAVCIGITVKEMQNFDKTGLEDKIQFIFQIVEAGQTHYVRSRPMKKSLHEKAGFWKLLASWTKQKDAETLISKMGTDNKFNTRYFIGKPIQLTIKQKEHNGKEYPEISDYMAPKKGQSTDVTVEAIPNYITKECKLTALMDNFTVKALEPKSDAPVATTATPACTNAPVEETNNSDDLPF